MAWQAGVQVILYRLGEGIVVGLSFADHQIGALKGSFHLG